ncbi:MAG: phage terminase small subunit P27 family [Alphaproteobacteria bacterium]|nr:MAG: phage terminase small subunit P27 family [Alphaproteobacteria bacterium]
MGRKSQPAEVKAAKGNPGQRKNVVTPISVIPVAGISPPHELSKSAVPVWNELVKPMVDAGFLRQTDTVVFGVFCQAVADFRRAVKRIERDGEFYKVKSNHGEYIRQHPACSVKERSMRIIMQYATEFGITPAARQKIQTGQVTQPPAGGLFKPKSDDQEKPAGRSAITFN